MAKLFTDFGLRSPACVLRLKCLLKNAGFPVNIHFLIDERARAQMRKKSDCISGQGKSYGCHLSGLL